MSIMRNLFKSNSDAKKLVGKKTSVWKPLGRLPMWLSKTDSKVAYSSSKKVNRYLDYMEFRLKKMHTAGEYEKIVLIWAILLKRSKAYQMCLFHRTRPQWYWKISEKEAIQSLKKFMNKCRNWDMKLTLERFYLTKPDQLRIPSDHIFKEDEKFRPIGSPTFESRMISKGLNDLIYFVLENRLTTFQHAYRMERGVHTALIEVWMRIVVMEHKIIREFDFQSYFNSIRIGWVVAYLRTKSSILAGWVNMIYDNIEYKFDRPVMNIPMEAELSVLGPNNIYRMQPDWKKPKVIRKGLPQGLSISPILATAVLDVLPKLEGLVMYADDGLIIREDDFGEDIETWFRDLKKLGVEIDPKKSGKVGTKFKFLGVEFDLEKEEVKYKESILSWKGRNTKSFELAEEMYVWFKQVGQFYGKRPERWNWNVNKSSMITKFGFTLQARTLLGKVANRDLNWREIFQELLNGNVIRGYRWFVGRGIFHISSSSTKCCNALLERQKDIRLVKVKGFVWEKKAPLSHHYANKGKYQEWISTVRVSWNQFWLSRSRKLSWNIEKEEKKVNLVPIRKVQTNKYNLRGKKMGR